jgi:lysophospholipase L1-like esterase
MLLRTLFGIVLCTLLGLSGDRQIRIFLIGDSTMADKSLIGNPERGWGQVFPIFFNEGVEVENHARNGRSTKSFLAEGRWQAVYDKLQPGDYVFIQFGHNDSKKEDSTRFADARTTYRDNLIRFIKEARSKGAVPILLTPVTRRSFDKEGVLVDKHGEYPVVVREVAATEHVDLIDLHKKSMQLVEQLGVEASKNLFLWIKPGLLSAVWSGKEDNTHFTPTGARMIAALAAEGLREIGSPLAGYLRKIPHEPLVGEGKTVVLDYYYNNEWRKNAQGKLVRYHYVWEDTTNSGYSDLGFRIARCGAVIDSLCQAPTVGNLSRASVYIIVDPDTPQESEHPNYVDQQAIDAIEQWVRGGGVLVLLENDKGNSEFTHFNKLASRFGITFNEDSRNRVVGTAYDTGKFDRFPDHPIFKGVRQIYMKEISTMKLEDPARAILTDNNDVIIASANVGRGLVFAVGDPWIYNEYITHRKLPLEYENFKAAENLIAWLLTEAKPVSLR